MKIRQGKAFPVLSLVPDLCLFFCLRRRNRRRIRETFRARRQGAIATGDGGLSTAHTQRHLRLSLLFSPVTPASLEVRYAKLQLVIPRGSDSIFPSAFEDHTSHLVHDLRGCDFHRHLPLDGDEPRSAVRASVRARLCLCAVGASLRAGFVLCGKRKWVANGYESREKGSRGTDTELAFCV